MSEPSPIIKSLKKEFAFIKAYIDPIYMNLENISPSVVSMEKQISKIKETKT